MMKIYKLNNKKVLRFKNKAAEFIKQYSTNTPEAPRNAFIDLKGRIFATFDQKFISSDEMLVVIEKPFEERLLAHLKKFLFLMDTVIEDAGLTAYFDLEGDTPLEVEDLIIPQKAGRLILSRSDKLSTVTDEEFTVFRIKNGLSVQGIDYDQEFILKVSEEFVSFTKGCYYGQEIVAKVYYRTKPKK